MKNTHVRLVVSSRMLLVIVLLSGAPSFLHAQPWSCDFGSVPATHTTGVSTSFLPPLPSGNTRVRVGTQGGAVALRNPGEPRLGSACEGALTGPTGGSLNKMQWYDFADGSGFTVQASIMLTGGDADFYLFIGNGSCFADNLGFTSSQVFAGLRWLRDSLAITCSYRHPGGWTSITPCPMSVDSVFQLEIYANNSNNGITYAHGTSRTLSPHSYDIWVDNVLIVDDATGAGLPDSIGIDSFMLYSAYCPMNAGTLLIDDLTFTNTVAIHPLPVELSQVEARLQRDGVRVQWRTETETQNFGFAIERSISGGPWEKRGFVPGDGDRHSPRTYAFIDSLAGESGMLRYRLMQIDRDGTVTISAICSLSVPATEGLIIGNPWPQPAQHAVSIPLLSNRECEIRAELCTLAGARVAVLPSVRLLPARRQDLLLPHPPRTRGVHVLTIHHPAGSTSRLLLFL